MENRQLRIRGLADTSAKTTSPCTYYSFGNFVNEADRTPIVFQFPANSPQILEKFCSGWRKNRKNSLLEAFVCEFRDRAARRFSWRIALSSTHSPLRISGS